MNPILMAFEETFADLHDKITDRLILEHLLKHGNVTIEEAKFYKDYSGKIIHESSHLLIPEKQELMESLLLEGETKILIDPESGEKYIYDIATGELIPAGDDSEIPEDGMDGMAGEGNLDPESGDNLEDKEMLADSRMESTELNENEILVGKLLDTLKR